MSSADKNLSSIDISSIGDCSEYTIGIVTSEWNDQITKKLCKGAVKTLKACKVKAKNIIQIQVPGSFELPLGAKMLFQEKHPDAVICIGCVIKGETKHNEYINSSVATALTNLSLVSGIPFIFGVLTPDNKQQALDRAGGKHGNKGDEAAYTALKMIALKKDIKSKKTKIGF